MSGEKNIYVTTNVSCNLNCIYCYEDKSSKDTFNLEKTKIKLSEQLSEQTDKGTIINLHGGEYLGFLWSELPVPIYREPNKEAWVELYSR